MLLGHVGRAVGTRRVVSGRALAGPRSAGRATAALERADAVGQRRGDRRRAALPTLGFARTGVARPLESEPVADPARARARAGPPSRSGSRPRACCCAPRSSRTTSRRARAALVRGRGPLALRPPATEGAARAPARRIGAPRFARSGDAIGLAIVHDGALVGRRLVLPHQRRAPPGRDRLLVHPSTRAAATRPRPPAPCSSSPSARSACTASPAAPRPATSPPRA